MGYFKFNIRKGRVQKDGYTPIYIKYYYDRSSVTFIPTGLKIKPRQWNQDKAWPRRSTRTDALIIDLSTADFRLRNILEDARERRIEPSTDYVKLQFLSDSEFTNNGKPLDFFEQLDAFTTSREREVSKDTIKDYKSLRKHLLAFQEYSSIQLKFDNINYNFYRKFLDFLTYETEKPGGEKGLLPNTVGKQIKNLKIFIRDRVREKIIPAIDLTGFKIITEEVDHIYLSKEEIEQIVGLELAYNPELDRSRDLLILGCLTGLRYSDLSRIKRNNYRNGMLFLKQRKVHAEVIVPLKREALAILKKYEFNSPKIHLTQFNLNIKLIGRLAGINELIITVHKKGTEKKETTKPKHQLITSHTCRRSFCTNEYLAGTDVQLIMKISGHKTEKSFKRYLKIGNLEAALKLMEVWDG